MVGTTKPRREKRATPRKMDQRTCVNVIFSTIYIEPIIFIIMSFHTFVPAEFHHELVDMSYDDQLMYLYEIVVAPVYLRPGLGSRDFKDVFEVSISSVCHIKIQTYIDEIKRMRAEHDEEDLINEYTKETIKKFFEYRGSSWLGYTDEYAWGEILKKAENEDMIVEIIARLKMYWSDVQYVQSAIDAFYNKASEKMKERIAKKEDEIKKFKINFNAKQKINRARFKMSFLRKSPELKFILQFRRIVEDKEVLEGIDQETAKEVWDDSRKYYKTIFDSNDYGKQVEELIKMYNRKKIKGRLVLYEILKDDSTWKGEIRRSTEDADNLAYFRKMTENSEIERKRRVEQVKKQRARESARESAEFKRKTEEAMRKMYN